MFFAKDNLILVIISGLMSSIAVIPFTMMFNMFIVDCADYNEMIGKPRMEGTLGSVTGLGSKIGGALGGLVMGAVLSLAKYDGTASVQTPAALMAIRLGSSLVPVLFFIVIIFLMSTYHLDEDLKEWREKK